MKAIIHDLAKNRKYVVASESQCKDNTDRSAYKMACTLKDTITMGKVIVQPILPDES